MSDRIHPDLERWLKQATAGLPAETAALARAEIAAHYADALDDYQEQGLPPAEAHTRALRDLGAADAVAGGFNDVHRGQRHYPFAAVASLLAFLVIFMLPAALMTLGLDSLLTMVLGLGIRAALMIYVVLVLGWLVSWRLGQPGTAPLLRLMAGGLVAESAGMILALLLFGSEMVVDIARTLPAAGSALESGLLLLTQGGRLAAAAGMLALSAALFRAKNPLYGLGRPLAAVTLIMGSSLALACLLPYISPAASQFAIMGVIVMHAVVWPLLTLVFFRAAYRSPARPARAV